jgi:hypothetical protein
LGERCLTGGLPEFGGNTGSFRRIVQTPGGISMFYDVGQGQGGPHSPANIRQWYGDSRGHWEGDTLVVDVTNFTPKTGVFGSRENLGLVERWTRTGPTTRFAPRTESRRSDCLRCSGLGIEPVLFVTLPGELLLDGPGPGPRGRIFDQRRAPIHVAHGEFFSPLPSRRAGIGGVFPRQIPHNRRG